MESLKQYTIALTNLYGMIHKDKLVEIYNMQNEEKITMGDVDKFISLNTDELENEFVEIYKDHFANESIFAFGDDDFEIMLMDKGDKPYYIPQKQELLKYADEWYFEKNKSYTALYNYLKKNFIQDEEVLEELCEEIQGMLHVGSDLSYILGMFDKKGIIFDNDEQLHEAVDLVVDFANNIRLWENNGYSPKELFSKFEKSNLKPLPNETTIIKKKKVGRNDPCPCGSGKKYKKCCIDKK